MQDTQGGTSPHLVSGPTSPLEALFLRALRRFGEMSPATVDGDALSLSVTYANEIIDDILAHPYFQEGGEIAYYEHPSEQREIPDHILVAGLLYCHARDQKSKHLAVYQGDYYTKLAQVLARVRFGTGAAFKISAVDMPAPQK